MTKAQTQKKPSKRVKKDKVAEITADLQRIQADFVNYKKRSEEEKTRAIAIGKSSVIMDLLPVLDNVDRALIHQPEDIAGHDWVKGVAGVSKQLSSKLADLGLVKIATVGEEFNPELMEAVSADGEGEKEIVSEELQSGYMLGDEVVRVAMVRIKLQ